MRLPRQDKLEEAIRSSDACGRNAAWSEELERERLRLAESEGTEVRARLIVNVQRAVADFAVAI